MRLCIPTTTDRGTGSRLSPHFGSAPFFALVDSATGETITIANGHARHEHGRCEPTRSLEGQGVDAVVCRGLGHRALGRLGAGGIPVLATEAWTVAKALEAFRTGTLRPLTPEEACAGGHGAEEGRTTPPPSSRRPP